jgi:DNA polymerase alpha subunit B
MLRSFALDPSTLFYKYEAFVMSRPSGLREKLATLTLSSARELRRELQREQATKAVTANATPGDTPKAGGVGVRKGRNMGDLGGL